MSIAIGVDPVGLHNVAKQCASIHLAISTQMATANSLVSLLQQAIEGSATTQFETKFANWLTQLQTLSIDLNAAATTLEEVATLADSQLALINLLLLTTN